MADSPTSRSMRKLRELGYVPGRCERFNAYTKRSADLYGLFDLVGMREGVGIVGIQCCSGASHANRRTKMLDEPNLVTWLRCNGLAEIWSWAKRGPVGKRKTWQLRREAITEADL